MRKQEYNRRFNRWLVTWLSFGLLMSFLAGGINCSCPEEPGGEFQPDGGASEALADDCYCVEPNAPCEIDGDCRSKIKYCIFLVCKDLKCQKPTGTSTPAPDTSSKDTASSEQTPPELPPTCPSTCTNNADCTEEKCGPNVICTNDKVCKPDIVVP